MFEKRGRRYATCTWQTYEATTPEQQAALAAVQSYAENMRRNVGTGVNIVLHGVQGTGKDHLLACLLRTAVEQHGATVSDWAEWRHSWRADLSFDDSPRLPTEEEQANWSPYTGVPPTTRKATVEKSITWASGLSLFRELRDRMGGKHGTEGEVEAGVILPAVLALSDPLPADGALSAFEKAFILRVLDARYSDRKATWVTINAANRTELQERLGSQAADRLLDHAICVPFSWPSYRKTQRERAG